MAAGSGEAARAAARVAAQRWQRVAARVMVLGGAAITGLGATAYKGLAREVLAEYGPKSVDSFFKYDVKKKKEKKY